MKTGFCTKKKVIMQIINPRPWASGTVPHNVRMDQWMAYRTILSCMHIISALFRDCVGVQFLAYLRSVQQHIFALLVPIIHLSSSAILSFFLHPVGFSRNNFSLMYFPQPQWI